MKKLLVISLVLAAMTASSVGYSAEDAFSSNEPTGKVTSVTLQYVEQGSTLVLKDRKDAVLYTETIEKSGTYSKGFDLSNLPDGVYYFEFETKDTIKVMPFRVAQSDVTFLKEEERNIRKPEVAVADGYVYISTTSPEDKSVIIDVYYEGWDLAYSERIKKGQKVNRVYDFSGSKKGNYVIVMKSDGRTFKNKVMI